VSGEFATLVGSNRSNLDTIIASLQTISATLASHKGDLDQDLSTLTAGLQPYTLISSLGQWFDVNTVYVCHGQETAANCTYQEGGPKPSTTSAPSAGTGGLPGIMGGYLGGGS
jgi:ABC-type transporter Mla subunit MlaD